MRVYFFGARLGKCRANPEDLLSARRPHVMMSYFNVGSGCVALASQVSNRGFYLSVVFKKRLIGYLKK